MNDNIKVKKFVFDDKNPRIKFTDQERIKFLQTIGSIVIQILEIETDNPSDLIFVATTELMGGKSENPVYLFSYRDKMLYQDGKYIMRFDYVLKTAGTHFELDFVSHSGKPFNVTAYYSAH